MMEKPIAEAWDLICTSNPYCLGSGAEEKAVQFLFQKEKGDILMAYIVQRFVQLLENDVYVEFWSHIQSSSQESTPQMISALSYAHNTIQQIANVIQQMLTLADDPTLQKGAGYVISNLKAQFKAILFRDSAKISTFQNTLQALFSELFNHHYTQLKRSLYNQMNDNKEEEELDFLFDEGENNSDGEDKQGGDVRKGRYDIEYFKNSKVVGFELRDLEWFEIIDEVVINTIYKEIDSKINHSCRHQFDIHLLKNMEAWLDKVVFPWLKQVLVGEGDENAEYFIQWQKRLKYRMFKSFGSLRISEFFDIIKEFPDSINALEDLKHCLLLTNQHAELIERFIKSLQLRLLQPGASTSQILDIYVSTVKALRILDHQGVILEYISKPVKEYLKRRKDTVRCIVVSLTDDNESELFEELGRGDLQLIQQEFDSDDEDQSTADDWEPDPIEADPRKSAHSRKSDDILSMLVNIYGSKELFVKEYRSMLADKLLQNMNYETDRDIHTLELLKLRFGEESLQHCEIMVKDIEESKRINANINSSEENGNHSCIDSVIVSKHFWPPFQGDEMELHPRVQGMVDSFRKTYALLKNPRNLEWIPYLGTVELSLEINGDERPFTVSPIQATIIQYFEDRNDWLIEELAMKMDFSESVLIKHSMYWLNHSILFYTPCGKYLHLTDDFQETDMQDKEEMENAQETAISLDAQHDAEVKVLETYIIGMLSNFGSLEINRIHSILSTFARSGEQRYDKTISDLSKILQKLIDLGKLEFIGGQYQLQK